MSFFNELKRRNVIRVAMAYVVAAWLIIQVVETILPAFGYSDAVLRYVVIILLIAFIPVLVFSWAFEITPEGLKREVDVASEHSITRFTGKKIDRLIMVLLALALGYFTFDKFVLDPARDEAKMETARQEGRSEAFTESYGDRSIAVLPFADMSPEGDQEYFSDGISEELLNLLARIPELRVISRSSAFTFRDKDLDIPTIAARLNVAHILEGSVRKDGTQLRITAQLIEARTDTHIWSDTYDRELESVFAIQDEISAAIVAALKTRLGLEFEAKPQTIATANSEAHDAYLRGRYLASRRTAADWEAAIREFETALALDPDYTVAQAELAISLMLASAGQFQILPRTEARERAAILVNRALALDTFLAEAHAGSGVIAWFNGELESASEAFDWALQLNPSYSLVHSWKALIAGSLGRYSETFFHQEQAMRLDPLSVVAMGNTVHGLLEQGRLDDAARELEKLRPVSPVTYAGYNGRLMAAGGKWAYLAIGNLDALLIDPDSRRNKAFLSWILAAIGLEQESLAIAVHTDPEVLLLLNRPQQAVTAAEDAVSKSANGDRSRGNLKNILARTGDYARAGPLLEKAWQRSDGLISFGEFDSGDAFALLAIRRDAGDNAGVEELLAALRDNVRRLREAGYSTFFYMSTDFKEGVTACFSGEREKGLALIARASADGYFIQSNFAYMQSLYDDPGFAPIRAEQEVRWVRERNRFLDIVCTDNPYREVWQPAEGTCERFTAENTF